MTTSDEHAPPEALSAFLDGGAPEWTGHVEGCATCAGELGRLRAVRAAVGRPVPPPPPSVVDQAVARALEEMPAASGGAGGGVGPGAGHSPVRLRRRSRAFMVGVASGSVAALVLAVLAAFAVIGGGGPGDRTAVDTALAPGRESSVQDRAAAGGGESTSLPAPPVGFASGGDLGEVGEAPALAGRLGGRIPGTRGAPVAAAASPPVASAGAEVGVGAPPPAPTVPALRLCEDQARSAQPGLGGLVYAADGSRQGRPVVVLGFRPGPAGAEAVSLLVLARDGCALVYATAVS